MFQDIIGVSKVLFLCLTTCYPPPQEIIIIVNLYQLLSYFLKIFLLPVFISISNTFMFCFWNLQNEILFLILLLSIFCFLGQHYNLKMLSYTWIKIPIYFYCCTKFHSQIHHNSLIPVTTDRYLGCFQLLPISNRTSMNILCMHFDKHLVNITVEYISNTGIIG